MAWLDDAISQLMLRIQLQSMQGQPMGGGSDPDWQAHLRELGAGALPPRDQVLLSPAQRPYDTDEGIYTARGRPPPSR